MDRHKFIFIAGLHRSGTSLLFECLRAHPQVSGFRNTGVPEDEGQFLQSVYSPANVYGGPGRFGFHPQSYLDETSSLASPQTAERLFYEWGKFWDMEKPFLLEKSPPNLLRTRFLQALYPEAYFIVLVRHPIAVSYATKKWSHTTLDSLLRHWLVCHEQFDADRTHLRNLLVLNYERFVAAPQETLNAVCAFLGIDETPLTRAVDPSGNDRYFMAWETMRRRTLTRLYTGYAALQYEQRLRPFGYSLSQTVAPLAGTQCTGLVNAAF
jgi:hypothetical protein